MDFMVQKYINVSDWSVRFVYMITVSSPIKDDLCLKIRRLIEFGIVHQFSFLIWS